jgi:cytochrome c oxidase subunit 1
MYDPQFEFLNHLCTFGAFLLGVSVLPFLINAAWSWFYGPKAPDNPWEALTLEWLTTSPPPIENWEGEPPLVTHPYGYGAKKAKRIDKVSGSDLWATR